MTSKAIQKFMKVCCVAGAIERYKYLTLTIFLYESGKGTWETNWTEEYCYFKTKEEAIERAIKNIRKVKHL